MPKRTDSNHTAISNCFRKFGATVHDTHIVGDGFPDIIVGYYGVTEPVEIKTANGKLDEKQKKWWTMWNGSASIAKNEDDVITILDSMKTRAPNYDMHD